MKVCVDRTRSALKEIMAEVMEEKNHVTLTKNAESGSRNSTSSDNENRSLSDDGMNMKMLVVVRKKSSLVEQEGDIV